MKTVLLSLLISILVVPIAQAQSAVKKRDLRGTWKLYIEIDKEEGDNILERAALGAVDGILSGMDITFQFEKNNELKVTAYVFDEEEVEYSRWEITEDGGVYIGDNEHLQIDDVVWYMDGDRLMAREEGNRERSSSEPSVYLRKMY